MLLAITLAALLSVQTTGKGEDAGSPSAVADTAEPAQLASPASAEGEKADITDKAHPDYVRCKSESVIGSRAKRKRTCMTNREWALVERRGNEASREYARDHFVSGQ